MFSIGLIIVQALVFAGIYSLIGGIALKIAYKIVFTKYSMEIADAVKLMFGVGFISYFAFPFGNMILAFYGIESVEAAIALAVAINFIAGVYVLMQYEGLMLGQSMAVGALTSSLFFIELLVLIAMVQEAAA